MLAFGLGLAAVVLLLRSRPAVAVAMVGLAAVVHPTTALWFVMWIGVALIVTERRARPFLLAAAAVGAAGAAWMILRGPLSAQAVRMDPAWLGVLATKDYLFATDWPGTMWAVAALYVVVVFAIVGFRRAMGLAHTREAALAAGLAALVGVFVVTLPLISQRIAVAVQFQISRVFWMLDLMAVVYAVWALADAGRWRPAPRAAWRGAVVAGLLVCAAVGRGVYVSWVEHPERALVQYDLPKTAWMDVMTWLRQTPVGTHVLADPAHAWREGVSVRVAAGRDVYLEEVKDTAMAMYSRRVAERVAERIGALGDFATLTPASAHALAVRFDLDYLVSTRTLDLPAAHRSGGLTIYRLK
ncbi:MAG: hypothetical protein NTY02_13845 [Acidobacteria bacterium]|nr:hypothetical protein [Acidobacteriota bacterium]